MFCVWISQRCVCLPGSSRLRGIEWLEGSVGHHAEGVRVRGLLGQGASWVRAGGPCGAEPGVLLSGSTAHPFSRQGPLLGGGPRRPVLTRGSVCTARPHKRSPTSSSCSADTHLSLKGIQVKAHPHRNNFFKLPGFQGIFFLSCRVMYWVSHN